MKAGGKGVGEGEIRKRKGGGDMNCSIVLRKKELEIPQKKKKNTKKDI